MMTLTEIACCSGPLRQRAKALLDTLHHLVPFDGAWVALADPQGKSYESLAATDLDDHMLEYLSGPKMARDIEVTGTDRARPPLSLSELPYPAAELPTWDECLIPAGYHEGLATGLFTARGRHVGFVALLSRSTEPPSQRTRRLLRRLTPMMAQAIDPMRPLTAAVRLVQGRDAGVVLHADGGVEPLPGLDGHALLARGSPALAIARARIRAGNVHTSFLWPLGGRHAPDGHTRVSALASTDDIPGILTGVVVLSPPGDLQGLTPRELEVLGLLVNGCSNSEVARTLVVAQRTVAAHLEHILVKLGASTRTLAAVHAERTGLYVPPPPQNRPVDHGNRLGRSTPASRPTRSGGL
jgi:DNA-binding CsgD family transcriptional regulator